MGIRFLQTFMEKQVPNGIIFVDIKEEVEKYKRQHNGQNPSIIIDTLTIQGLAYTNSHEVLLGGRYNMYTNKVKDMFSRLKNLGVNLIFFIDGPPQEEKLITCLDRRNGCYDCCAKILQAIEDGIDLRDDDINSIVQNITPFSYNFAKIVAEFGSVRVSHLNECDLEIASFAKKTGALAIISQDTDFLIYEGDWHYWAASEMDFDDLTTIEYNRNALREFLSLSNNQMPLFATISGNDIIKFDLLENFLRRIAPQRFNTFHKVAEIVRKLRSSQTTLSSKDMRQLLTIMFPVNWRSQQIAKPLILSSLKSYNYNDMKTSYEDDLSYATSKDVEYFNFVILANRSYLIPISYYDLSDSTFISFYDLIIPLIRSEMGILLQHLNDHNTTRKFYYKKTHEDLYQEYEERPRYPEAKVPPIMDLLFTPLGTNEILDNTRWDLLCWQISPKLNSNILKEIPKNSLTTVIVIFYLFEKNQIDVDEADCLILANNCTYDVANNLNLEDATIVNGRDAKLAFLFSTTYISIKNCFYAVGLKSFCSLITFDGLYFHILRKKWSSEYNRFDKENKMSPYQNLRLYCTEYDLFNRDDAQINKTLASYSKTRFEDENILKKLGSCVTIEPV